MATYVVLITRDVTESTAVKVEAATPEEAENLAFEKLSNSTDTEWRVDDGSWNHSEVYVTAVDRIDKEREPGT